MLKIDIKECNIKLSSAPASIVYNETPHVGISKGAILFYHGLKACKETNLKELKSLAEYGFLAVGIDNAGHGERHSPDLDDIVANRKAGEEGFLKLVRETVDEIPSVIDALVEKGLASPDKIGVSGISMGGYIAYGSVLADKRIKASAPILGSPVWESTRNGSPHYHPDDFYPTALLVQNAGKDINVPARFSREFIEKLTPRYKESPQKLNYIEYPNSEHFMLEEDWNHLWSNVLNWFDRFLV